METYQSTVDARGRIAIQLPVRRALGLQAGGQLMWRQIGDRVFELLNASNAAPGSGRASSSEKDAVASQASATDAAVAGGQPPSVLPFVPPIRSTTVKSGRPDGRFVSLSALPRLRYSGIVRQPES